MKTLQDLRQANYWIFDLDNTLYPHACDLFPQVEKRMTKFICERLSLDWDLAKQRQKSYFHAHGTTLRGLMEHDNIDPYDFLDFVHDIDYSILSYDSGMDSALQALSGRKVIFTNGSVSHAENVLDRLSIGGHFDFIFDIAAAEFTPKPHRLGYDILLKKLGLENGAGAVMVEDIANNLHYPHASGMMTLWVENDHEFSQTEDDSCIDFRTSDLVQFLARDVMTAGQ